MTGYDGRNCQINIDDCQPNPCLNGGICFDGISDCICMCPSSYTGMDCETALGACHFFPCENNSTCIDGDNYDEYQCLCSLGYTGMNCTEG